MDPDATVRVPIVAPDGGQETADVRVRDVLEELLGGDGSIDDGPLDTSMDADYLLGQATEAVIRGDRSPEEYVREIALDLGVIDVEPDYPSHPVGVLMDIARYTLAKSESRRTSAGKAATTEGRIFDDAQAGAFDEIAGVLRDAARWMDDEVDRAPVAVEHGRHRRSGNPIPWREADGG